MACLTLNDALNWLKFIGTLVAAFWAAWTYHQSVKLARANWMKELYEKFYEHKDLKSVRDALDGGDPEKVNKLIEEESPLFTDYLNFFEFLAYLRESKQISDRDLLGLFNYYLENLKSCGPVLDYINDDKKGFEKLKRLLSSI